MELYKALALGDRLVDQLEGLAKDITPPKIASLLALSSLCCKTPHENNMYNNETISDGIQFVGESLQHKEYKRIEQKLRKELK